MMPLKQFPHKISVIPEIIKTACGYLRPFTRKVSEILLKFRVISSSCLDLLKSFFLIVKSPFQNFTLVSDDTRYKKHFDHTLGQKIYQAHMKDYLLCCAFCSHLFKSSCHDFCFSCSKKTYADCSCLLPGTYSFTGSRFDLNERDAVPWIFKTPCTGFERLEPQKYFRNFNSFSQSVTVANYEALEGVFMGISRGKRPCHICASENIDIFNRCSTDEKTAEHRPCNLIIQEISIKYKAITGVIKYLE